MTLQPEICYTFRPLGLEEINRAYANNESVTAFVESVDPVSQTCQVHLGNNIFGVLPFNEVTVYPLKEGSDNTPIQVHSIKGRKIRVKITAIDKDKIMLSRKDNMIRTSSSLCKDMEILAHIRRYSPEVMYLDVGEGLTGILHSRNINTEKRLCRDDIISVKILQISNNYCYTLAHDNIDFDKYIGRVLEGMVLEKIGERYLISLGNHVKGFLKVLPEMPLLANGTIVKCYVYGASSRALRLYLDKNS